VPNRILREGILTSPRMVKLNWAEEVFYRRLHSIVDDFGRYYADHGLLRAACYPRQLGKVSDSDIGKWMRSTAEAGLVRVYEVAKERYLELLDFRQQVRAKVSRFPQPPSACAADATQMIANAHLDVVVSEDVSVVEDVGDIAPRDTRSAINGNAVAYIPLNDGSDFGISVENVAEFEKAYPAVDCKQTLQEIRAWCVSNTAKRKTRGGVLRFVNSWLAREQNKAR
jgi:hypothetical protein